jgi:hypothetical protein
MKHISKRFVDKFKTHSLFSIIVLENPAVAEIRWNSIVEPNRPQLAIRCMRISCWIPKAKNTHSQYVTLTAFPPQQWLHERASLLSYTYIASFVKKFQTKLFSKIDTGIFIFLDILIV